MLIDLHAHSGFSKCCKADGETVLKATKDRCIDGVILTNHYTKIYLTDGITPLQLAEQYIREYYEVKKVGDVNFLCENHTQKSYLALKEPSFVSNPLESTHIWLNAKRFGMSFL